MIDEEEYIKLSLHIGAVKAALWSYHNALDTRQHGGIAADKCICEIENALGTPWVRGATLANPEKP